MPLPRSLLQPNPPRGPPRTRSLLSTRRLCQCMVWTILILVSYQGLWSFYLAGVNVPDVEIDKETGIQRIRRRPHKLVKRDHKAQADVPTSPFDGVMEGHLGLLSIKTPSSGLHADGSKRYRGVKAVFCHLSWSLQDRDPTSVPTFKQLRDSTPLCHDTRYEADLWEVTRQAQQYDWRNNTFAATQPGPGQGPHPPAGVLFHQSRCGSTVASNIMAAFRPKNTRVYSEATAPMAALSACDDMSCDEDAHIALIQDVFYLMGRTPGPELPQFIFFKLHSAAAHHIDIFEKAMPRTPWVFLYREPTEIIMSHLEQMLRGKSKSTPNCLRQFGFSQQPKVLTDFVASKGTTVAKLSKEEYCAAHLASLGSSVLNHNRGMLVNYNDMPHIMWEKIVPSMAGKVTTEQQEAMRAIAKQEARTGKHFHDDSQRKRGTATEKVQAAVRAFMQPVYEELESARKAAE